MLAEYKIHHCELLIREDITVDQLIDVLEGNRKYVRCLYVYNKADALTTRRWISSAAAQIPCASAVTWSSARSSASTDVDAEACARVHQENWKQTRLRRAGRPADHRGAHGEALLRTDSQHAGEDAQVRASVGHVGETHGTAGGFNTPSRTRTSSRSSRATRRTPTTSRADSQPPSATTRTASPIG